MEKVRNIAFIAAQNLNYSTTNNKSSWKVGLKQFRTYLLEKYKVDEAYYFLGCVNDDYSELYNNIQKAGFILVFREHSPKFLSVKKGNVGTDIVFSVMKKLYKQIPAKYRDYLDKPEIKKKIKK